MGLDVLVNQPYGFRMRTELLYTGLSLIHISQKERVEIRDFSGIPFIFTGHGCCYRGMFEREMTEHSVFPHIVLETSSIQVIKESAMSGLGLCVLPEFTVKEEMESGRLVKIPYK